MFKILSALAFLAVFSFQSHTAHADCSAALKKSKSGKELLNPHAFLASYRDIRDENRQTIGLKVSNAAKGSEVIRVSTRPGKGDSIGVARAEARIQLPSGETEIAALTYLFEDGTWIVATREALGIKASFLVIEPNQKISCREDVDQQIAMIEKLIALDSFDIQSNKSRTLASTDMLAERLFGAL